jgi:transcriptional regulator with GAF, ATPase, and Fis domain
MKTDDLCVVDAFQPTLTASWREACRHIEISESATKIAKLLTEQMPIGQLLVRRVDQNRSCVETVAVGLAAPEYLLPDTRTQGSAAAIEEVCQWCRQGEVAHRGKSGWADTPLEVLVPAGVRGDLLLGPLTDSGGAGGVLVIAAAEGATFDAQHVELMELLLEPFSTALENDRRLHEMAAMRAAAEAEKHSLLNRLGRKEIGDDTVVGLDSGLRGVFERVGLVAKSDAPVLILGETGTGKELIARMIHNRSPRAAGPFMRVNCGAIPSELIDSQLFGHERGAFTGAVETRPGWFERADGGTLLLDEVGELPLAAQVRLLRILQDGWLEKVGGQESIHVDVRIVAATHRDLAAMVNAGKFREDLWYRIAVFPIILPPLRERAGDIPELARHFAERAAARFVLPPVLPTPPDIELLTSYAWPGNIRELAAVIDRAAILGDGKRLEVAKALGVTANLPSAPSNGETRRPAPAPPANRIATLDEAMRQHVELALTLARGRIEGRRGAAALLKINPHTLRARMRKLGIDWTQFRRREEELLV